LAGYLIDSAGWRSAFYVPGVISILLGISYWVFINLEGRAPVEGAASGGPVKKADTPSIPRRTLIRVFGVIFFTTAIGGLIFQSTTFALPKIFAERLADFAGTATMIG
jgi:hypothetical protein